jgi:hypothetical protein
MPKTKTNATNELRDFLKTLEFGTSITTRTRLLESVLNVLFPADKILFSGNALEEKSNVIKAVVMSLCPSGVVEFNPTNHGCVITVTESVQKEKPTVDEEVMSKKEHVKDKPMKKTPINKVLSKPMKNTPVTESMELDEESNESETDESDEENTPVNEPVKPIPETPIEESKEKEPEKIHEEKTIQQPQILPIERNQPKVIQRVQKRKHSKIISPTEQPPMKEARPTPTPLPTIAPRFVPPTECPVLYIVNLKSMDRTGPSVVESGQFITESAVPQIEPVVEKSSQDNNTLFQQTYNDVPVETVESLFDDDIDIVVTISTFSKDPKKNNETDEPKNPAEPNDNATTHTRSEVIQHNPPCNYPTNPSESKPQFNIENGKVVQTPVAMHQQIAPKPQGNERDDLMSGLSMRPSVRFSLDKSIEISPDLIEWKKGDEFLSRAINSLDEIGITCTSVRKFLISVWINQKVTHAINADEKQRLLDNAVRRFKPSLVTKTRRFLRDNQCLFNMVMEANNCDETNYMNEDVLYLPARIFDSSKIDHIKPGQDLMESHFFFGYIKTVQEAMRMDRRK